MADKKEDYANASYVIGIASIVLAFFTPLAGLIFGIIGINLSKKQKSSLAMKGKKLSQIGLVISIIVLVITIIVTLLATSGNIITNTFPVK